MKIDIIHSESDNTRLILVFAGWSAGRGVAEGIVMPGWDTAVVYDYSDLSLDTSFLNRYYTVYLFAWSLGVFAASRVLPAERITAAFAINGTLSPIDDLHGIPTAIYNGTADNLDTRNLMKFRLRMAGDRTTLDSMQSILDNNNIDNLKQQLNNIKEACNKTSLYATLPWTRAFISTNDKIFPAANQEAAWSKDKEVELIKIDAPHYVSIKKIVSMSIADLQTVSKKFSKASISYDTYAVAQYTAAIKLARMLEEMKPCQHGNLLEIGCGTGLFTREHATITMPKEATFVDITKTGPFGIAENEKYIITDAEKWIEQQECKWDIIVSASAIQWFADIPRFLHECYTHLQTDGVLAISTFLPGNMEELDALRPSPLLYPKESQLFEWLNKEFKDIKIVPDEIRVEFKSSREMLMHLKHTGVGGSSESNGLSIADMSHLRSLTYRPVYVTARK